ncbi:protein NEGATIVE REGULATOR OF RESISTANCE-like [Ipomoea triloba]|uniref:protein NEGATIVE REGULATOR OF RESISTANCE-like n=1 Tax=Ipomoea triloba TaxID=35885 RepID=UPI00125D6ED4|nr:protein NEGATIVE REGULATOR OF RESISTANCE-like [Ipomoea triloba]
MEVAKRKMLDDREAEGKRAVKVKAAPAAEDDGGESKKKQQAAEAEDEEVEEFYAILKRIRVAVKYFEKGKGGKKAEARPAAVKPWSPSFQREDFDGAAAEEEDEEEEEEDAAAGLDLNAEPDCRRKTGKITSGKNRL